MEYDGVYQQRHRSIKPALQGNHRQQRIHQGRQRPRAFPEGEERTRINNAFQNFFVTLKTETTPEGNTRLYSTQGQSNRKPYYQIPFSEGLKRAVDPAQRNQREPVFVSETPQVFRDIGFTALPMMNVRHLRLNYYSEQEFQKNYGKLRDGENAHSLHTYLNGLPNALKYPLAVVANLAGNAKQGSVVAITNMDVAGKKVVVPVLIEATNNCFFLFSSRNHENL